MIFNSSQPNILASLLNQGSMAESGTQFAELLKIALAAGRKEFINSLVDLFGDYYKMIQNVATTVVMPKGNS